MGDSSSLVLAVRALASAGPPHGPEGAADRLVAAARICAPGASIGLVVASDETRVVAASDDVAERADGWQLILGSGPTVTCLTEREELGPVRILTDDRWPDWSRLAAELVTVDVVTAFPIPIASTTAAVLSVYSSGPLEDTERRALTVVAAAGAIALGAAQEIDDLAGALDSRSVIGQAQGILMERFQIDAERAFAVLKRVSQHGNVKLRAIAEEMVRNRVMPGLDDDQIDPRPV